MKKSVIVCVVALGILIAGCGTKREEPVPGNSNTVVVAIGDAKLMSADLDADVAKIIEANLARIPSERLAQMPPQEMENFKKRMTQQFSEQIKQQFILTTLLKSEAAKKGITVTDDDVKARADEIMTSVKGRPGAPATFDEFLAQHPFGIERARAEFRDSVLIGKVLESLEQEFADKVVVDPKDVENQYNQMLSTITRQAKSPKPEQVRASHILIKAGEKKTSDVAKKEIDALYAQLKDLKGDELAKKFAELAREKSDCPSKAEGGDLGAFGHGRMVPEFDKAAFEQEVGKLYAPVKTSFGWHLILVKEKIPAKSPTDEEVKKIVDEQMPKEEEVGRMMKRRQVQEKVQGYVRGLLEVHGFAPPAAARPAPPPKPAKVIESEPVELKPSPAKPTEAAKPVEAVKPSPAKPAAEPAKSAAVANPA